MLIFNLNEKIIIIMKNLFYSILIVGLVFLNTGCSDFLETSSPSDTNREFIFSEPLFSEAFLTSAFETWRDSKIHSNGLFYELVVCSSDAERHPEKYADQQRHIPENFYFEGTAGFNIDSYSSPWENAYKIISTCNTFIDNFEATDRYKEAVKAGVASDATNLYGQAVALRATIYLELCRFFGDVPHQISSLKPSDGLTSRDEIYEYHINKLKDVAPLMYRIGESGSAVATKITRTYVEGLIGRLCLYAGGYSTRRTDLGSNFYKSLDGTPLTFDQIGAENSGGIYTRRTDYLQFYQIAKKYLADCVANPGSVKLVTSDPRAKGSKGQLYGNPYQYVFQQMLNLETSSESIYEIAETQGVYSERPYAFGRPSNGGGSNAYPCKSYGQSRFHPTYYYGDFDPNDMRRDVTVAVTASSGKGKEVMISMTPGSKSNGGLVNNKWDENRMNPPYIAKQRQSGVNNPYMRMSDVILMLAEVYAELGEDVNAKAELAKVHNRAFANATLADLDGFITKNGGLKEAISEEVKLEFGGEGIRKFELIRTGKIGEAIVKLKSRLSAMIAGLETNGYYEFENGNVISNYIWTKSINAKDKIGYRLTTQCPDENDPLLFPGWRGQYDNYEGLSPALVYGADTASNLAIKGLFNYIDPASAEATALVDNGYVKTAWGADIVKYKDEYSTYVFRGYTDGLAPIYTVPINYKAIALSDSTITNGYGFNQQ
jgi:hypothetical protein